MDVGANIGLSVLFFKSIYPNSKIIALEPDPSIFKMYKENIKDNGYANVLLIQKAAWTNDERISFQQEGSDAGRISTFIIDDSVIVETVRLKTLIEKYRPDFLKMDIEGAEAEVLLDCKNSLNSIQWLFVEYHSRINSMQKLDELLEILIHSGFRIHLSPAFSSSAPFLALKTQYGFDMQINIFAWR